MRLVLKDHSVRPGVKLVEVRRDNGDMLATIVPGADSDDLHLRIISAHVDSCDHHATMPVTPDGIEIFFKDPRREDYQRLPRYTAFEKRVAEVRAYAEAHVWDPSTNPDFVPGRDERHIALLKDREADLRFVFTVTKWEGKLQRQLSLSSPTGALPHPKFMAFWAQQFGFTGIAIDWQLDNDGHGGINILQPYEAPRG